MSLDRRTILAVTAVLVTLMGALPACAGEEVPWNAKAFQAAQDAGRPVIVHVVASWCPTCKAQKPIVSELMQRPAFKDLTIFDVDFDAQKDIVRSFDARMQSTFVVFKGKTETARSVGETRREAIEALMAKAL